MLFGPWKRNYRNYKKNELHTLRVIRKKHQEEEECHHLAVLLRAEVRDEIFGENVYSIVGREIARLPKENYLELSLLLKKKGSVYYCPQCGRQFDREGYEFYKRLFERARDCGFSVWKLKTLFAKSREGKQESCLKMIRKGNQIYRCSVSRMEAGFMKARMDTDKLYDEVIRRFR